MMPEFNESGGGLNWLIYKAQDALGNFTGSTLFLFLINECAKVGDVNSGVSEAPEFQ